MSYRVFEGDDWLERSLVLRKHKYAIVTRTVAGAGGDTALAVEGRKAMVYQLRRSDGRRFALKVFKKLYAAFGNVVSTFQLSRFATTPGLRVCEREVLLETDALGLDEPGLAFAILMPWMEGMAWAEIVADRTALSQPQCLALARKTAEILGGLEDLGLAHADVSSSNVFVEPTAASPEVELIDVEDMYHRSFLTPGHLPAGTPGYNHRSSSQHSYWNQYGDRFAGAVILAEMLTWHQPGIRTKADEFSYFHRDDTGKWLLPKYQAMVDALELHSSAVAELFRQAWRSDTLAECPSLGQWRAALRATRPAATRMAAGISTLRRSPLLDRLWTGALDLQTELVSRVVCLECGKKVRSDQPTDHAATCLRHPDHFKPSFDISQFLAPANRGRAWPGLGADTPVTARACGECKNLVSSLDGRDHRVICSKHPDYAKTQPSRFSGIRFLPLSADDGQEATPSLLSSSAPTLGPLCPECSAWIPRWSTVLKHNKGCSRALFDSR